MKLDDLTRSYFTVTENFLSEISLLIKPIINDEKRQSIFSRSTTRKIFSLLNSQYINHEGRSKVLEATRSLGEHIYIDCIRHYQNPQQLKDNLEAAIHLLKGHFPEPVMQAKVLKTILLFLKCCHPITSGEDLVESMAQIVQRKDPYGILSSVHDIVHLLSIAPSCFQMVEQADSSSSIKLKPEFQNYESIRRAYDSRIIEMAMSNGMVDSPECVDLLLKADLNVNAQDQHGNTPAMVACFFNKPNILRSLIAAKADLTLKNNEGKDANSICEERGVDECKAVLQNK